MDASVKSFSSLFCLLAANFIVCFQLLLQSQLVNFKEVCEDSTTFLKPLEEWARGVKQIVEAASKEGNKEEEVIYWHVVN